MPPLKANSITSIWGIKAFCFVSGLKGLGWYLDGAQWQKIDFMSVIQNLSNIDSLESMIWRNAKEDYLERNNWFQWNCECFT